MEEERVNADIDHSVKTGKRWCLLLHLSRVERDNKL